MGVNCVFSQTDTLPYTLFKDKIVLYSDLGYSTAPFSLKYNFAKNVDKLKYRNNIGAVLGLGMSYKWFALRIGIPLPGNLRPYEKFGSTKYFDVGVDFSIKKTFCDFDVRNYLGYAIKNGRIWNDTLTSEHPNEIKKYVNAFSTSLNVWYFHNRDFKMTALRGKTGHYEKEVKTWYLRSSLNFFGVGNGPQSIVPDVLIDTLNSKTGSNVFSSFDIGIIPGYAYVNKINNWQFSILGGLGAVMQIKSYVVNENPRSLLGLAPRYDFRLIGGYTVPRYFVFLVTDFDNKSIRFQSLVYRQSFYTIRIVGGVRLDKKKKEKKKLD